MPADFAATFTTLRAVLANYEECMSVKVDTPAEYTLLTKTPSPLPQHKGQPMYFGSVRLGKAYVSFHLMPLYMCDRLNVMVSPALKKRMQGKTCFSFKNSPEPELIADLKGLTGAGLQLWRERQWA
jgi:hypothetical protein